MKEIEKPWIEEGYHIFALEGPSGIKVERLAKAVGKNKSSFYHLFADTEAFIEQLLAHHLSQAEIIAGKEANAGGEKELIAIILEHKIDLLFNRQLRIHRERKAFETCFTEVNQITFPALLPVWKKVIGLNENSYLAEMVLALSIENFFLQITDSSLNETWLASYFHSISGLVNQFSVYQKMD